MKTPISTIMTCNVITIKMDDDLQKARDVFTRYRIKHLPVEKKGKLRGIISVHDLPGEKLLSKLITEGVEEGLSKIHIRDIMEDQPVVVSPDDDIYEVAKLLARADFHALPVVDDNRAIGIVTSSDIIKYFLNKEI